MKKTLCFSLLLVCFSYFLLAQDLPMGYKEIQLGQTVEEVREILEKDSSFGFRGERDVSLLPTEERVLIETSGSSFFAASTPTPEKAVRVIQSKIKIENSFFIMCPPC